MEMVLDDWYEGDLQRGLSYHDDHGTGLDNYDVKRTLGAGAAAPFVDGNLILNSNFTGHEVLDNGPLRTTFRLTYPDLVIGGILAPEKRTLSIDAGTQLTRVEQEWGVTAPITAAVGVTLRSPDQLWMADATTLMIPEPATAEASGVYFGALLPSGIGETLAHEYTVPESEKTAGAQHRLVLATAPYTTGTPLVYYTGFGWEKWGDWTAKTFATYLADRVAAFETPFVITVK